MSTNIIAATGCAAGGRAQIDLDPLDITTIATVSVWLAFYVMMLIGAIADQTFAGAVALSGYY